MSKAKIESVFGVQWIESEFGQRDEGWCLFVGEQLCIESTKEASRDGPYEGGYYGPERPLTYYEIPFSCLDKKTQTYLRKNGIVRTDTHFQPKFKSVGKHIDERSEQQKKKEEENQKYRSLLLGPSEWK